MGGSGYDALNRDTNRQWTRVDTIGKARNFFFANDHGGKDANLKYKLMTDGGYQLATYGTPEDGGNPQDPQSLSHDDQEKLFSKIRNARKYQVQVFRSPGDGFSEPPGYEIDPETFLHPNSFDNRLFTLTEGFFLSSSDLAEAAPNTDSLKTAAAGCAAGAAATIAGGPTAGVGCAVGGAIGGIGQLVQSGGVLNFLDSRDEDLSVWLFTNGGNPRSMQVLRCQNHEPDGNRFIYTGSGSKSNDYTDDDLFSDDFKIANLNHTMAKEPFAQSEFSDLEFHQAFMAKFLCADVGESAEKAEKFCNEKGLTCKYDSKSLFGGIDPLSWALGLLRSAVGAFIGLVTDALTEVIRLNNLSSYGAVTDVWKVVRDLANILFILALSAIAFSTMLRINTDKYSIRALLPRLVFAIIAVNFSLLFVTVIVNTATVLSQPFMSGFHKIGSVNPGSDVDSFTAGATNPGTELILLIAALVTAVVLLILVLLFIFRVMMLWVLAAVAPLAILFSVLPFSRSLASMWLKQLLKWAYLAPIAIFILWLGVKFLNTTDSLSNEFVQMGVFIGAVIAAVMVPLRLGGEIMQRAVQGSKSLGKKLPGVRTAGAYLEQRKGNQEQGAKLRAAAIQGGISSQLSQFPGGRAAASVLTGGRAGMIGAQQAALEKKYASDIDSLGLDSGSQRMVARGDVRGLRQAGLHDAANLARNPAGRRAAGRLLAQSGSLNRDTILGGPGAPLELNPGQSDQVAAGNQTAMKQYNPVLGNMNRRGNWSGDSLRAITAQAQSTQAEGTKNVHWSDVVESLKSNNPEEHSAAKRYVENVQSGALEKNFDTTNRNYIDAESERDALAQSLVLAGHKDAAKFSPPPP